MVNAERLRLDEADTRGVPWGSERQWGTVREDGNQYFDVVIEYAKAAAGQRTGAAR